VGSGLQRARDRAEHRWVSATRTAEHVVDLLEELVTTWVPADVEYGLSDAACVELPAEVLRASRRRFRRDAEGRLRRVVDGVPVLAVATCWEERETGCGDCRACVGADSDVVVFHFWNGSDELEVVTQFAPVEFSDEEAQTYTALRSQGLSIADARAMTAAVLS